MLKNKSQVLALALEQTNRWFVDTLQRPDLRLRLIDAPNAASTALTFTGGIERHRQVDWDWAALFHRKVKHRDAWMFAVVRGEQPSAMCYGRIEVGRNFVSVEYLERRPYTHGLRGLTAHIALQFAASVASLLEIEEVRLNQPFAELVDYYMRTLGANRHPSSGAVQYLFVKIKP